MNINDTGGLAPARLDFTPDATMARATAHAAEQARRAAAPPVTPSTARAGHTPDPRTPAEVLDALARGIERAAAATTDRPKIFRSVDRAAPDRPSTERVCAEVLA